MIRVSHEWTSEYKACGRPLTIVMMVVVGVGWVSMPMLDQSIRGGITLDYVLNVTSFRIWYPILVGTVAIVVHSKLFRALADEVLVSSDVMRISLDGRVQEVPLRNVEGFSHTPSGRFITIHFRDRNGNSSFASYLGSPRTPRFTPSQPLALWYLNERVNKARTCAGLPPSEIRISWIPPALRFSP